MESSKKGEREGKGLLARLERTAKVIGNPRDGGRIEVTGAHIVLEGRATSRKAHRGAWV